MKIKFIGTAFILLIIIHSVTAFAKNDPGQFVLELSDYNKKIQNLSDEGKLNEAIQMAEETVQFVKEEVGVNRLEYSQALSNLATLYGFNNDLNQARELYLQVIPIEKKLLGPDDLALADSYFNLGLTNAALGQKDKALRSFQEALRIKSIYLASGDPAIKKIHDVMGSLLYD